MQVMLQDVRGGKNVLGIFYGHPGVFVSPSHRALAIARSEGYKAKMLPGVSAEDYLFADLEFDPSVHGCATFEATELLIREKPLNPMMHNIIWQVGAVGVDNMIFNVSSLSTHRISNSYVYSLRMPNSMFLSTVWRRTLVLNTRSYTTLARSCQGCGASWTPSPSPTCTRRMS